LALDGFFPLARRSGGMAGRIRSWLRLAWPFVGTGYLAYLALQPPAARYVGAVGLAVVTPLLAGWITGRLFGVGPWADGPD
jgi:hypothetical protein